ncbi:hypothetical protein RB195_020653 [Necator americanus]|uniref:Uncharacterized protein n=1 Tax=Necator americanus TaxID=51031 RepID=A0ABR1CL31_NECAM
MRRFLLLIPVLLLSATGVLSLGGKSFLTQPRSYLINKSYALITLCEPQEKLPLNVSVSLNPFQENQVIKLQRADVPIEINPQIVHDITQITVAASPWPVPLNIKQITVRLDKKLFKLLLNPNCDSAEGFWTSPDMTAYWGRFIDCDEMDTYCDSRADEISDCDLPFAYYLLWRNGVDRYE